VKQTNVPYLTNLRQDPWERYQKESMAYATWWGEKTSTLMPSIAARTGRPLEDALKSLQTVKN